MNDFCNAFNLSSLIKDSTCYRDKHNSSCIDLILTNSTCSFQGSCMVKKGLSHFHRMVITIMKTTFQGLLPKLRTYRNCNKFYNHKFQETLVKELSSTNTWNNDISNFIEKHAPLKRSGNHFPFMNKELSKAIMSESKLHNNFLKHCPNENRKKSIPNNGITVSLC